MVSAREDIESATVQILAEGSFVDPETGEQLAGDWGGSGFIIDPSGIAVTNNHVVTGSALLQVYISGENEPRNAKVLGVSECADLAVIDIEGGGYPYFEWNDGEIDIGLDVYAAGFPLGDPEFTLTKGIVSKAEADGETPWASIDSVIEHDATIHGGNSGGPLVNVNSSKVVGVNTFTSIEDPNATQFYAISREEADEVIAQLREGQDVDSIGVNGEAIAPDAGGPGIWVNSVQSGSPASEAGVQGGDFITQLEGIALGEDGTMSDYCDVLRSHEPSDTLSIQVFRTETGELLEGQLNGRNLETSLAPPVEESGGATTATAGATAGAADGTTYSGYTTVTDSSGVLEMEVPTEWSDVQEGSFEHDGESAGPGLWASADYNAYIDTWEEPGAFFGASRSLVQAYSVDEYLDTRDYSDSCDYDDRYSYEDELYAGKYDLWVNCGEEGSTFLVLAAVPENQEYLAEVNILILSEADVAAVDRILSTFQVVGEIAASESPPPEETSGPTLG